MVQGIPKATNQFWGVPILRHTHTGMGQDETTRIWTAGLNVNVSIYYGNPFGGYPIVDPQPFSFPDHAGPISRE